MEIELRAAGGAKLCVEGEAGSEFGILKNLYDKDNVLKCDVVLHMPKDVTAAAAAEAAEYCRKSSKLRSKFAADMKALNLEFEKEIKSDHLEFDRAAEYLQIKHDLFKRKRKRRKV